METRIKTTDLETRIKTTDLHFYPLIIKLLNILSQFFFPMPTSVEDWKY